MGFKKSDLNEASWAIGRSLSEIHSPYNDGYVQSSCKHELYMLKCWLEDEYAKLPIFVGEEKWAQERVINLIKQK
jgi:hypothetical protein